jgi:uncharacterized protein
MDFIPRLLRKWMAWVMPRPRLVLGLAFATALASVVVGAIKLDVETDQLELISPNHPLIALTDRLDPFNFGGRKTVTVVIEAPTPPRAVAFLKLIVKRIQKDPHHFENVWFRLDPNLLKRWALFYLDREDLLRMDENLKEYSDLVEGIAKEPNLLNFLTLVNREMASRLVGELFTGFLDDEEPNKDEKTTTEKPMEVGFLINTLEGLNSYLSGSPAYKSPWSSFFGADYLDLSLEGYFWESGKRFALIQVLPRKQEDGFETAEGAIEELRKIIVDIRKTYPDVEAGVTGEEALNTDEMTTVLDDMARATWLSLLGVLLLMILFFRGFRRPLIETISLTVGICWTIGWTALFIGHLNILSVVFAPLLCGLGVDYGIHWFARYEEEERSSTLERSELVRRVMVRSGPGIFTAGISAAFSFLPFILTGFKGLLELGLITGFGTLLLLLADFTILPTSGVLSRDGRPKEASSQSHSREKDFIRFGRSTSRWILAGAVVICAVSAWSATRVYFDLNPLRLQAPSASSVVWEKRLIENSKRSVLSAAVFAHSPEEVIAKSKKLEALPAVSEVENIFSFLPEHQVDKVPLIRALITKIPELHAVRTDEGPPNIDEFVDVFERIRFKMREDEAEKWGAQKVTVEQMARVRNLVGEITGSLRNSPGAIWPFLQYRARFQKDLLDTWDTIRESAAASPMRVEDIPGVLKERYLNDDNYLIRIYPRESIWEQGALTRFVQQIQGVDPLVVGDPVSLYVFASAYKHACILASVYAVAAIVILLAFTFRKLSLVLLALVPLGVGTLWTVGIMGAVGVSFNLANSIFMPLVVGAGVEYGVIILHRWGEGRMVPGHLPMSTAKGVILAALTTTVGFGTLMISRHRGIFSLGFVAGAGSICVLLSAIILLPSILARMKPPERMLEKEETEK